MEIRTSNICLDGKKEKKEITDESFGLIRFARVSGSTELFGSDLLHNHWIELTISQAYITREFNEERIAQEKELIKIALSPYQFSEAITTLNWGIGVPCTIDQHLGKRYNYKKPFNENIEEVKKELDEEIENKVNEIYEVLNLLDTDKNISPKKAKEIKKQIESKMYLLKSNAEFTKTQFNEYIDKKVVEVKMSVDTMITHALTSRGLESLKKEAPTLLIGDESRSILIKE